MNYFITVIIALLTTHAFAAERAKGNRKPANSSTIECTAYSVGDAIGKLEIGAGNNPTSRGFRVDGEVVKLKECEEVEDCSFRAKEKFHFQTGGQETTVDMKFGKTIKKQEMSRGEYEMTEFRPVITIDGGSFKMYGVCASYNY